MIHRVAWRREKLWSDVGTMTADPRLGELRRDPAFRRLWVVGGCGGVARWLEMLVAGVFAFEVTGLPLLVALLVILRMMPLAVFGSIVGTFADRLSPRLILCVGLSVATLVSATVVLLFVFGLAQYWHVAVAPDCREIGTRGGRGIPGKCCCT